MKKEMKIVYIPLENIGPNPYQPRTKFSETSLRELARSIESYGVLQPITVRQLSENRYELIAGERRYRAAKLAGLTQIAAIVSDIADSDSAMIALIENIQRENLDFVEEAESYFQLMQIHDLTQEQIAKKVGKSQSTIANKMRILKLSKPVRDVLLQEKLTERHGRALLKIPDEELQLEALKKVVQRDLNVKKTEELVEHIRDGILQGDKDGKVTPASRAKIKSRINLRIYTNTLKQAYTEILKTGVEATYDEIEKDDGLEVRILIKKNR
ncbi:nucleoid occlusion protein [Alkalibacter rhizosphaerae]|uniref:Nucleoid occlusion protein n=1 Tax=Alkalibacter rhizosphaerae TaxID=2815577 RepID=A0A974XD17_9FIRM|nr:nucleoid occlusion protein [Alkalibacter rhizosphaerae]QSX07573.1 nucleoid occlusion protein [Alkalibacter rhizosphaerae]